MSETSQNPLQTPEELLIRIYAGKGLLQNQIWELYHDTRVENRVKKGMLAQESVTQAIKDVGEKLDLTFEESTLLYGYLYRIVFG